MRFLPKPMFVLTQVAVLVFSSFLLVNSAPRVQAFVKESTITPLGYHNITRPTGSYVDSPTCGPQGPGSSCNWAGYVDGSGSGAGFQHARAKFNVPCTDPATISNTQSHSMWVGIGGYYGSKNLLQAGIMLKPTDGIKTSPDGWKLEYHLFWENYYGDNRPSEPAAQVDSNPNHILKCTDRISAEVWYDNTNHDHVKVQDLSQGWIFEAQSSNSSLLNGFTPDIQSTDWIDERPECSGYLTQLSNFGWTDWSQVQATPTGYGNKPQSFSLFGPTQSNMYDTSGTLLAFPSNIFNDNQSFQDYWDNAGVGAGFCI